MKKFRIVILLLLVFANSCSKEDEIKSLNELVDSLQNKIAQLNSEINDYSNQITNLWINTNEAQEIKNEFLENAQCIKANIYNSYTIN